MRLVGHALCSVLAAVVLLMGAAEKSAAQTGGAARFLGTVTIDGSPAFEGMIVLAQVNGNNCGSTNVVGGRYEIDVTAASQKEGCGTAGAVVVFVWGGAGFPGGTRAQQTGTWDSTKVNDLNLAFIRPAAPTGSWLDRPPGGAPTEATCPRANQWLLLYWNGPESPIRNTATACANADRYWVRKGDRWQGFNPAVAAAFNDDFSVVTGEAVFVRGSGQ